MTEQEDKIDNKVKQYTAFGVTGGISIMILLAIVKLIEKPAFWLILYYRISGKQ